MSCYCDNCYWGISPCLNEDIEVVETQENDCYDEIKTCSGFTTALVIQECGVEVDDDEAICSRCEIMRDYQEDFEDEAVERVIRRDLELEQYQLERKFGGDTDGDNVVDEEIDAEEDFNACYECGGPSALGINCGCED
jgi:hypothetical protein